MSSRAALEAPPSVEPAVSRSGAELRRRQLWLWGLVVVLLLALLSVFSGGFFLYAALVVGGLLLLSTVLTSLSIAQLRLARHCDTAAIPIGSRLQVRLELHNAKPWPALWLLWRDRIAPGLDVEGAPCAFETLPGTSRRQLDYRLHTFRRGLFRLGPALVEASGPFGLVKRYLVEDGADFVTVFPRSVPLGEGWPLGHRPIHQVPRRRSLFEDPSRFQGVRAYRPGDSPRRIHWRATARSGELQVKLFEPAVLDGLLLAVEMSSTIWQRHGEHQSAELGKPRQELAVTAALSLAEWVLACGQSVGLLSNGADAAEHYADEWTGGTFRQLEDALQAATSGRRQVALRPLRVTAGRGHWQADRLRLALARLEETAAPGLGEMLLSDLPRLPRGHVVMVVTPELDAPLVAALEVLQRAGLEVAVVWVTARGAAVAPSSAAHRMPSSVPVYAVASDSDLQMLGSTRL